VLTRPVRTLAALLLPLSLVVAACSSSKDASPGSNVAAGSKNSIGNSIGTGKANTASAPSGPAAALTTAVVTDDGGHYTVTVTPKAPDNNATCATVNSSGHLIIPFTVTVRNDSGKEAPQPKLGFAVADAGNTQPEIVAVSVPPVCIDFVLTGEKLPAGGVATYQGSISNGTATTKLTVNVNNSAPGTPASFPVPIFAGSK
jgi:hypothetical protein